MASVNGVLEAARRLIEDYEAEEAKASWNGGLYEVDPSLLELLRDELQWYELISAAEERANAAHVATEVSR